jgi:hypothetical protein
MRIFAISVKMQSATAIKVHDTASYSSKQSRFSHLPPTPLRGILCAPSGSGKTVTMVDMVVRLYSKVFERVYVFSPTVFLDHAWKPVFDYSEKVLGSTSRRRRPSTTRGTARRLRR